MSDHVMSDEVRQKLLGRCPFNTSSTIDYTPEIFLTKTEDGEYELEEEYRPVFLVSSFNKQDAIDVSNSSIKAKDGKDANEYVKDITERARKCTKGWKNLYDPGTMQPIDYKTDINGGADKDLFNALPLQVIQEIFVFISGISGLKNFERSGL